MKPYAILEQNECLLKLVGDTGSCRGEKQLCFSSAVHVQATPTRVSWLQGVERQTRDTEDGRLPSCQPPFYLTGVDYFGLYIIKVGQRNEKRGGIKFKCLTTRAVHLNLLSTMDIDYYQSAQGSHSNSFLIKALTSKEGRESWRMPCILKFRHGLLISRWVLFHPSKFSPFWWMLGDRDSVLEASPTDHFRVQTVTEEVQQSVFTEDEEILNSKPLGYISSDVDPFTSNSVDGEARCSSSTSCLS